MINNNDKFNSKDYLGVTFLHLKGKFALADRRGNPVSGKFNLDQEQVEAIFKYFEQGAYKGMFSKVERALYGMALGYHYDAMIDMASTNAEKEQLKAEYQVESDKLQRFADGILSREEAAVAGVRQPE
jgi:hypothetical protein